MGRKSTYNAKDAAEIVERLSKGEPLAVICRDEHMPAWRTVYDWMDANAEFSADIARGRAQGHDAIACRARETARGSGDSTADVQRDKLIIETDLKLLAKWDKRYGDKQQVEHSVAVPEELAEWLNQRA
jgi:hypothetical protein